MHYFDNAATTRVDPMAGLRVAHAMNQLYGNPSSLHKLGREAAQELLAARRAVAAAIGAEDSDILFTSGGTESSNHAITAALHINRRVGRHVISSEAEHPSVREALRLLAESGAAEVTFLKPERSSGIIPPQAVAEALREDTALISLMLVNNETGTVNPIREVSGLLRERGSAALFHCDAVQGLFKIPIDAKALDVDFLALSAHKIHGPKGVGALYIRKGLHMPNLLPGGGQESGLRSGTEPMPAIAGFGVAAHIGRTKFVENAERIIALRKTFEEKLAQHLPQARIHYPQSVAHIVSLCLPGCPSEVVTRILSDREIYLSSGSACAKGRRSHVLTACGLPAGDIDCTLRVSFSAMNEVGEIDPLMDGLTAAYGRFHR